MEELPKLRPDLQYSTYTTGDGKENVVVTDPVAVKYYRMSKYEYAFLHALDGTVSVDSATEKLRREGRHYTGEAAKTIFDKASQAGLLLGTSFGTAERQLKIKDSLEQTKKVKAFSSLFYVYIPLLDPDRFLERTVWIFRLICNRWTGLAFLLLLPGALYLLIDGLSRMFNVYLFFFNLRNVFYLWVAIALTKVIHEFAHAYVAKSFGLRVPVLGVGFILFFPVMYCDTTDAWTLADRKQRMAISGAGILAEAVMAVIGLYVWYFSSPGIINSIAFYQMSYSLLSTVLFNGNPLIKFDGYFVLMDLIRMPNLAAKAQAQVKYLWMNKVLGLSQWSSSATNRNEAVFLSSYGLGSYVYRLSIVFGIVVGVYHRFDKTVGILLAVSALLLNVGYPLSRGIRTLAVSAGKVRPRVLGSVVFILLVAAGIRLLFMPWSSNSVFPCYVDSSLVQKLTIPLLTSVKRSNVREGSPAQKGQILFELDSSELQLSLLQKQVERDVIKAEAEMMLADPNERERANAAAKEIEARKKAHEIERIRRDLDIANKGVVAPSDGFVTLLDPKMQEGYRPGEGAVVGEFKSVMKATVHALIPDWAVERVAKQKTVKVWLPIRGGVEIKGRIQQIRGYGERDLAHTPFSSAVGGELATEELQADRGALGSEKVQAPLEAYYIASFDFDNREHQIPLGMTGRLVVPAQSKSLVKRLYEQTLQGFHRESLF